MISSRGNFTGTGGRLSSTLPRRGSTIRAGFRRPARPFHGVAALTSRRLSAPASRDGFDITHIFVSSNEEEMRTLP